MANSEWLVLFPSAQTEFLPFEGSDHRPLVTKFCNTVEQRRSHFRYNSCMFFREGFRDTLIRSWEANGPHLSLDTRLHQTRKQMALWKRQNQLNASVRIATLKRELDHAYTNGTHSTEELHGIITDLNQAYLDEEHFWKIKSRKNWMKLGDRNTKYFYAAAKERLARNRVLAVTDDAGNTYRGDNEIGEAAENYFTNLFKSTRTANTDYTSVLQGIQQRVTSSMNEDLQRMVTEEEIQKAVFAIGADRAPGPDGITAAFYQQFWPSVKDAVIAEVTTFFQEGIIKDSVNHTNICLIPKKEVSTSMTDFRPIALCNVRYKIISKILVERLKTHLSSIVSENQAAFIQGRNIMDNVVIAHEMLHSLKKRKRWANSYMTVKTDITKAYDRLEWDFIRDTMKSLGFDTKWIHWVMQCVESVCFSVLINGAPRGMISPERGIRQGDPLSPYLFILCAEVLSSLLTMAEETNRLKGMKISAGVPSINHLLFVDDALFFCHAHPKSCSAIMSILREYEEASGQAINLNKSAITFGSRVQPHVKTRLRRILNIHNDGGNGKYMGLLEQIGRRKKEIFDYVIEKVKQRTRKWSHKFLSEGGKEVLLKTIAIAVPVYTMNVFKLPKGTAEEINKVLAQYWWSKSSKKKPMHWISWKRMSLPKTKAALVSKI